MTACPDHLAGCHIAVVPAELPNLLQQHGMTHLCATWQAEVGAAHMAMETRVQEAVQETQTKQTGLKDARERNVHFSARVVALNSRVGALQRQVKHSLFWAFFGGLHWLWDVGQQCMAQRLSCKARTCAFRGFLPSDVLSFPHCVKFSDWECGHTSPVKGLCSAM